MKIYNYNSMTKEYIGESIADENPLEEGVFLLPANATFLQPPNIAENEVAVFENDLWIIKADYRGGTFYSKTTKEPKVISEIGIQPDDTMTHLIPGEFDTWGSKLNKWTEDLILVSKAEQEKTNLDSRKFLDDTDWKIIRHRDQLDLGIKTSLTGEEYKQLLQKRQESRERVMEAL
ncbi:MAG: tail fiber assembly protein [Candidatus Gastranaerophilales bacterium]|nr:tail fiber assembly protein [Candidatus Gastranaerophilales bacterium]